MRIVPALSAFSLLFAHPAVGAETDSARTAAAATAAGCATDGDAPFSAGFGKLPGQPDPAVGIVATVSGGADDRSLGDLCVALVRGQGNGFSRIASEAGPQISPPSEVEPVTNIYTSVEKTPFRFKPTEIAFGVEISGEYDSSSTNMTFSTLYLFRRQGDRILPIFHARTSDTLIDKTDAQAGGTDNRWIIRFDIGEHNGAYDLLLQRYHGKEMRRFIWNGGLYLPAKR